jgi:hypothetical protein
MESLVRMISQKSSYCSRKKAAIQKSKINSNNEPALLLQILKAKVDVPAEVSSQVEAVNEGNQ